MTRTIVLLGFLAVALSVGCAHVGTDAAAPLRTVASVDLERYLGTWYEIARYPNRFQEGCVASMATYTKREDGRIRVVNECREGTPDGKLRRAEGGGLGGEGSALQRATAGAVLLAVSG